MRSPSAAAAGRRVVIALPRLTPLALGASVLLALALAIAPAAAHAAGGRSFTFVESSRTTPRGHADVRFWGETYGDTDFNMQAVGARLGYGLTDRLDLSVELEYDQGYADQPIQGYGNGGYNLAFGLAFARLRARYRLVDPGRSQLGLLLEVSIGPNTQVPTGFVVDDRVVLQRRYGHVTLMLNGATREFFARSDGGVGLELSGGVRYAPFHVLRLGVEGGALAAVPPFQPFVFGGASLRVGTDRLWVELYFGGTFPSWGPLMSLDLGWTM